MALNADNITLGAASITADGTDVGHTGGPAIFRYEPTYQDIESQQVKGVVKKNKSNEKAFIEFTMLEATLGNLRIAMGFPASNLSGSTLTLGYNNACIVIEHTIVLVAVAPSCGTRTITLSKCVVISTLEYNMDKDNASLLPTTLEVLKKADGTFGDIVDT